MSVESEEYRSHAELVSASLFLNIFSTETLNRVQGYVKLSVRAKSRT